MGRLRKEGKTKQNQKPLDSNENDNQGIQFQFDGVIVPVSPQPRVIFILENASLHKGIFRKKKILNAQEDGSFLLKHGKNPDDYRPDIFYAALVAILDSQLNQAGMVGAVYVQAILWCHG